MVTVSLFGRPTERDSELLARAQSICRASLELLHGQRIVTESSSSVLRRRTALALAGLLGTNAASFALLPDLHHEHHQKLGVSPALERRLPALMGAMSLAVFATRNRRRSRALVGAVVASYYVWASSVAARSGELVLAGYGVAMAGAAGSLVLPGRGALE